MKVGRCYKCGADNALVVSEQNEFGHRTYVACPDCQHTGPTIDGKDKAEADAIALDLWNWRSSRRWQT